MRKNVKRPRTHRSRKRRFHQKPGKDDVALIRNRQHMKTIIALIACGLDVAVSKLLARLQDNSRGPMGRFWALASESFTPIGEGSRGEERALSLGTLAQACAYLAMWN